MNGEHEALEVMLRALQSKHSTPLRNAIARILDGSFSAEEVGLLAAIDRQYADLLKSEEELTFVDHGLFRFDLTAEELRKGTERTVVLGEHASLSSLPRLGAIVIFSLLRELRPRRCLELGTCVGYSTAHIGAALRLNGDVGHLVTMEASQPLSALARERLAQLGLQGSVTFQVGRFDDLLPVLLAGAGPFDFIFEDGEHTGIDELARFSLLLDNAAENCVLVIDDIRMTREMEEYWDYARNHKRTAFSAELRRTGFCIFGPAP
jgi:predicted O-methyltransferase YrrM